MTSVVASTLAADAGVLVEPMYLHLPVTDTDTEKAVALAEVSDGRGRQGLALIAPKFGVLSINPAHEAVEGAVTFVACE